MGDGRFTLNDPSLYLEVSPTFVIFGAKNDMLYMAVGLTLVSTYMLTWWFLEFVIASNNAQALRVMHNPCLGFVLNFANINTWVHNVCFKWRVTLSEAEDSPLYLIQHLIGLRDMDWRWVVCSGWWSGWRVRDMTMFDRALIGSGWWWVSGQVNKMFHETRGFSVSSKARVLAAVSSMLIVLDPPFWGKHVPCEQPIVICESICPSHFLCCDCIYIVFKCVTVPVSIWMSGSTIQSCW